MRSTRIQDGSTRPSHKRRRASGKGLTAQCPCQSESTHTHKDVSLFKSPLCPFQRWREKKKLVWKQNRCSPELNYSSGFRESSLSPHGWNAVSSPASFLSLSFGPFVSAVWRLFNHSQTKPVSRISFPRCEDNLLLSFQNLCITKPEFCSFAASVCVYRLAIVDDAITSLSGRNTVHL